MTVTVAGIVMGGFLAIMVYLLLSFCEMSNSERKEILKSIFKREI